MVIRSFRQFELHEAARSSGRREEELVADEIGVREGVRFLILGEEEIDRAVDGHARFVSVPGQMVEVGDELVVELVGVPYDVFRLLVVVPGFPDAVVAVHSHDGAEGAHLHPADKELGGDVPGMEARHFAFEAAQVVGEVAHALVGSPTINIELVIKHRPVGGGVAGEIGRIALGA